MARIAFKPLLFALAIGAGAAFILPVPADETDKTAYRVDNPSVSPVLAVRTV